jgi:FAD binding domain-containing protein
MHLSPGNLLSSILLTLTTITNVYATCKTLPSNLPASNWDALNETLNGNLLAPPPPGGVCFPNEPNYNKTLCPLVQTEWNSSWPFIISDPIAVSYQNWVNDTCWPFPGLSFNCSGAGYPEYVVNASTVQHVQAGINFARENNVRLVVKATGHDFRGRSTAPNSLSIWVHNLKGLEWHDNFTLSGSEGDNVGPAVTYAAGENSLSGFSTANQHGHMIDFGGAPTLSPGGYAQGGGHSVISAKHGLAADNILEANLVTPDGKLVTANAHQNSDLFWAIRGGGGGTFGVLINVTVRAFPSEEFTSYDYEIIAAPNATHFADALAYIATKIPEISNSSLMSYSTLVCNLHIELISKRTGLIHVY